MFFDNGISTDPFHNDKSANALGINSEERTDMGKTNNEYYEIDLMQLLRAMWKKAWAIVLAAVIGGGIAFSYATFFVTPMYEAEAMLYVNNTSFSVGSTSVSISSGDLTAAQSLVNTYIVILNSRRTLNEVISTTGVDYSYEKMKSMLSAKPVNSTEVFSITVTSHDPQEAEMIANAVADILPDKIADIVDGSSVRIVDYAVLPAGKVSPSITRYATIGALLGCIAACAVITIMYMSDTLIHDEDYLIDTYNLPVLAVIPDLSANDRDSYYVPYGTNVKQKEKRR